MAVHQVILSNEEETLAAFALGAVTVDQWLADQVQTLMRSAANKRLEVNVREVYKLSVAKQQQVAAALQQAVDQAKQP